MLRLIRSASILIHAIVIEILSNITENRGEKRRVKQQSTGVTLRIEKKQSLCNSLPPECYFFKETFRVENYFIVVIRHISLFSFQQHLHRKTRDSQNRKFFLEKSNIGVVFKHWQKEQRLLVKKHTLKSIMFEINTSGALKFKKCYQSMKSYTYRCGD